MHSHTEPKQWFCREIPAGEVFTPHSGLETFYFLANYKPFPEFPSIRRMHGEVIRRDNCKKRRKDHLYPRVAQRRGMQRGKEKWKKPYFLRVASCVTGYSEVPSPAPGTCRQPALCWERGVAWLHLLDGEKREDRSRVAHGWRLLPLSTWVPSAALHRLAVGCPVIISYVKSSPQRTNAFLHGSEHFGFIPGNCCRTILLNMK